MNSLKEGQLRDCVKVFVIVFTEINEVGNFKLEVGKRHVHFKAMGIG